MDTGQELREPWPGNILGDGTPDECWKWGLIYYNPNDPSFMVEKRMGVGWTLNMGNKWSRVFSIVVPGMPGILWLIKRWVTGE